MSTDAGLSTSSHDSSALNSRHAQTIWRQVLLQHGVDDEPNFTAHDLVEEEEGAHPITVTMDDMQGWEAALKADQPPNSPDLLVVLYQAIRAFLSMARGLSEEDAWTAPVLALLKEIFRGCDLDVSNNDRNTSSAILPIIQCADLISVKPDAVIGLLRPSIRIALNADSPPLSVDIIRYVLTRDPKLVFEPSDIITSMHYFSWFYCEFKGPVGMAGKAVIQIHTACLIGLRIHMRLAVLARAADSASFRPPTWTMRRTYGLQTGGLGNLWTLVVMVAQMAVQEIRGGDEIDVKHYVSLGLVWSRPCLLSSAATDAWTSPARQRFTIARYLLRCLTRNTP